ncbi:MAG: sodium-dependent transporter [Ruminiclostridium sp.]|nr:sodium-dependent transporter [Ruminiclostridium sp.]
MEKSTNKVGFGSRLGFILAAAGSAVGLGNIWRFPYLAAKYGGGIFLLVYLILTVTFGFTLMITEISIGRRTGKSVLDAYGLVNKKFKPLGFVATLVPIIVLPYYCVIGGWVLKYLTVFVTFQGDAAANTDGYFGAFISNTPQAALFLVVYVLLTAGVVLMGVQKGIEKMSKIMMPILIFMTIGISIYSLTVEGALEGLKFYLLPDFSRFSIETIIAAMGQLFYSLSIAMGIMITYGSYMPKSASIETSTRQIELFDTGVAFLSGLMIIPAVVAFSGGPEGIKAGPGLMFETLPKVFISMPGGNIVGIVFFLLVLLAALTSSISLMETIVAAICEKTKLKRKMACVVVMIGAIAVGMLSVLGYSVWKDVRILGKDILDFFDFISNNAIMPLVAMFTCILIGYIVKTKYVEEEIESSGVFKSKKLYRVMVKFIAPVCLLVIFIWSVFMPAL